MASSHLYNTAGTFLFLFLFLSSTSSAVPPCQYTPYPSFCRSTLINNSSANVYDYGRFSVRKSISAAHKFSSLIDKHLSRSSSLTTGAIRALQDCQYLAGVNIDFLTNAFQTVVVNKSQISSMKSQDIQTMLSAILTNTQTCIDGLEATAASWSSKNGILAPLANDNKLYSVSLSLFNRGWGTNKTSPPHHYDHNNIKKHTGFNNGRLPLKMSERSRAILGRRKLVQAQGQGGDEVVVSDIVVVSQDGSGNFTSITDAINIAPNKSTADDGYFLIYVAAGVYQEYVNIPKNKVYLMIIGDGINQTVITGNHNVVDGWTTFNSATFSKTHFLN